MNKASTHPFSRLHIYSISRDMETKVKKEMVDHNMEFTEEEYSDLRCAFKEAIFNMMMNSPKEQGNTE